MKNKKMVPVVLINLFYLYSYVYLQVDYATTESVVTVDWENGFAEASAARNENITQVTL